MNPAPIAYTINVRQVSYLAMDHNNTLVGDGWLFQDAHSESGFDTIVIG